ncbi:hypothetical protein CMV_022574 [Castanea mollissima]|uniref:Uncharacterized protein n=1 Tax=Castanea mollissima TaxID=60419 RepID=A0A8J4QS84_9ROSI|nr:hypothetical protein CMV_022574 [Castanea mollissima]
MCTSLRVTPLNNNVQGQKFPTLSLRTSPASISQSSPHPPSDLNPHPRSVTLNPSPSIFDLNPSLSISLISSRHPPSLRSEALTCHRYRSVFIGTSIILKKKGLKRGGSIGKREAEQQLKKQVAKKQKGDEGVEQAVVKYSEVIAAFEMRP